MIVITRIGSYSIWSGLVSIVNSRCRYYDLWLTSVLLFVSVAAADLDHYFLAGLPVDMPLLLAGTTVLAFASMRKVSRSAAKQPALAFLM